jgi:uncharacterized membrane protein
MDQNVNEHNQHHSHWKRLHHSFGFWIFLGLMLVAIVYYIMTVDFAFAPHQQMNQPAGNHRTS